MLKANSLTSTELGAPLPSPPGFDTQLRFNETTPLDPAGVYLASIELMWRISQQPWAGSVDLDAMRMILSPSRLVGISVFQNRPTLQPSHIVLALLKAVMAMYRGEPGFFKLDAEMTRLGVQTGRLVIDNPLAQSTLGGGNDTTLDSLGTPEESILIATSGVIDDADWEGFSITWILDGAFLSVQEIFIAVLNGIATIGYDSRGGPSQDCEFVTGLGAAGNVAFHVSRTQTTPVLCILFSRAIYLTTVNVIVGMKHFQEMGIVLKRDGLQFARGCLYKIRGTEEAAARLSVCGSLEES